MEVKRMDNETTEQYNFRKKIYKAVYDDTRDSDKSIIYSNIWVNILSLGCEYPAELMTRVEKYRPDENDNPYK
jgi:hypothetical protein